jgi:hypothetical protein
MLRKLKIAETVIAAIKITSATWLRSNWVRRLCSDLSKRIDFHLFPCSYVKVIEASGYGSIQQFGDPAFDIAPRERALFPSCALNQLSAFGGVAKAHLGRSEDGLAPDNRHGWQNISVARRQVTLLLMMELCDRVGELLFERLAWTVAHERKDTGNA